MFFRGEDIGLTVSVWTSNEPPTTSSNRPLIVTDRANRANMRCKNLPLLFTPRMLSPTQFRWEVSRVLFTHRRHATYSALNIFSSRCIIEHINADGVFMGGVWRDTGVQNRQALAISRARCSDVVD